MSVNLITGNLFSPIQASQDSDYQAGTFGEKTQILNVGSKMAVSIVDNSTIRCEDGVLVTREGRRVQIDNGDVVEWTIPTGTQGTTSYYIVGFRLYTDDDSAQLCDTFVQSVAGPGATITEDTFRDGAVEIFVSVARVVQNGITLGSIQPLIPTAMTIDEINDTKQDKTDNSLTTVAKTIVGAIAEVNKKAEDAAGHLQNEIDGINDSIRTNLLNPTAQTQTDKGVTLTNNGDGTYTVNGTASGNIWFTLNSITDFSILKNIKLVGCPVGGGQPIYLFITCYNGSTWVKNYVDYGDGVFVSSIPPEVNNIRLQIAIRNGYTANNLLFKPMLTTDLNATYDDYIPYSGNGALNENVAEMYDKVLDTSDIATALAVDYSKSVSHIGMIVQSTTLNTEAKVKSIYGGVHWALIEGRMLLGASTSHAVNTTGGSETHTLAVENLPSHSHGLNNHTHSIPALSGSTGNDGTHSHEVTDKNGIWFANQQGNLGGTQTNGVAVGYGTGAKLYANAAGSHTHTVATNASTTGGNSDSTTATGSGTAFDTMPPYKAVYIWERTA